MVHDGCMDTVFDVQPCYRQSSDDRGEDLGDAPRSHVCDGEDDGRCDEEDQCHPSHSESAQQVLQEVPPAVAKCEQCHRNSDDDDPGGDLLDHRGLRIFEYGLAHGHLIDPFGDLERTADGRHYQIDHEFYDYDGSEQQCDTIERCSLDLRGIVIGLGFQGRQRLIHQDYERCDDRRGYQYEVNLCRCARERADLHYARKQEEERRAVLTDPIQSLSEEVEHRSEFRHEGQDYEDGGEQCSHLERIR